MQRDRRSSDPFNRGVDAECVADLDRSLKGHLLHCSGYDPATGALTGPDAGRQVHLCHDPATENIAIGVGVARHGKRAQRQFADGVHFVGGHMRDPRPMR